jgi:hypothetical protein
MFIVVVAMRENSYLPGTAWDPAALVDNPRIYLDLAAERKLNMLKVVLFVGRRTSAMPERANDWS